MSKQEPPHLCFAVRKHLGITQARMAALLQVHPMTVSRWERGVLAMDYCQVIVLKGLLEGSLTIEEVEKDKNL